MADFSSDFREYVAPDKSAVERVITQGLVVLDTNVLLDLYRYASTARNELLEVLQAVGDRLWIPHQVALEFHRNRATVIAGHGDAYRDITNSASDFRRIFENGLAKDIREFANRVALPDKERDQLIASIESGLEKLAKGVTALKVAHGISDRYLTEDPVLKQLQTLLSGKVGSALPAEEHEEAIKEAQRRVDNTIPPGFRDSDKDDPSGDYLLWIQSLKEAKSRSAPLLLVTRDSKSDWFLKIKGKTFAALPALVREAYEFGEVEFVAMATRTFLIHSKKYLHTSVSDSTLKQAEAVRKSAEPPLDDESRVLISLPAAFLPRLYEQIDRDLMSTSRLLARLDQLAVRSKRLGTDDLENPAALKIMEDRIRSVNHKRDVRSLKKRLEGGQLGRDGGLIARLTQSEFGLVRKYLGVIEKEDSVAEVASDVEATGNEPFDEENP